MKFEKKTVCAHHTVRVKIGSSTERKINWTVIHGLIEAWCDEKAA